jgi:hypothetical protein
LLPTNKPTKITNQKQTKHSRRSPKPLANAVMNNKQWSEPCVLRNELHIVGNLVGGLGRLIVKECIEIERNSKSPHDVIGSIGLMNVIDW